MAQRKAAQHTREPTAAQAQPGIDVIVEGLRFGVRDLATTGYLSATSGQIGQAMSAQKDRGVYKSVGANAAV